MAHPLPGHLLLLLREHTVIAEPCLRRKGRITTCSPRRENKQPSVSGGGDSFKGYSRGLKPKESPQQSLLKSVLSLLLGLPVSGYQSLLLVLGSLPTSPTSDPKMDRGTIPRALLPLQPITPPACGSWSQARALSKMSAGRNPTQDAPYPSRTTEHILPSTPFSPAG